MVISQTAHGVLASERVGAGAGGAWELGAGGTDARPAAGGVGAGAGAGGAPRRRWLPPAARVAQPADHQHDHVFRKVRGILNKLTPEKFGKLSDDLLALDLGSDKVLKGVILLIFEKALDEPKYSSMYAQLCKRLSEEAPNLEPPGQPCTFKLLLLNKCRAEFENRAQAFAAFEDRALPPDEEEKRHLSKCKMLGNIKFIGELGKLEILSESILHRCIQNLLARRAAAEHHEDLECLAQLVRTCGRVLDSERGRRLMDQYFTRIETLSASRELAPRIRFMLRDVAELRRGGWVPRAATHGEGPVPIQQLRRDDEPPPHHHHHHNNNNQRRSERDALFRARARPLDDVLAGLSLAAPAAALVPPPQDKLFGNGFGRQRGAPSPGYYRGSAGGGGGGSYNKQGGGGGGKEAAPRFTKSRLAAGGALEDVQMRPAANSLLFTANRLSKPPPAPLPLAPAQQNVLTQSFASTPPLMKEPSITIKPAPDKKDKPKKDKGPSKEEAVRVALSALRGLAPVTPVAADADEPPELAAAASELAAAALPDKLLRRAVAALFDQALADEEPASPWAVCALVARVKRAPVIEPLRALLQARHPHDALPALLAHAIAQKLLTVGELGALCEGGAYYPLLLQALQHLAALIGMERVQQLYNESKVNICLYITEGGASEGGAEGGAGGAGEALEAHGLGALAPALRLQGELARALQDEPAPAALYRWIKAHVEPAVRQHAAFVSALVALLAGHVTLSCGSACAAPARDALERERTLLEAYAPLLTALLDRRPDLQLAAVYAVQVHAHRHHYPKGMLLRWFMYLYNLEVCEEDAFLRWREDVTDAYPGKGEALFQVNTWLTWLQQQESEEEEAED